MQPYEGLFVLDAAQGIAGPYCGMLLAAMGADVVKLEPPAGDWSRGLTARAPAPPEGGQGFHSVMSTVFNRGKRGIMLDLTTPAGRAHAQALAALADVVIEAFRPGVAARIGLGVEHSREDAIYVSISGFGQTGPYSERPCTDGVAQAFSGIVALNPGADGTPHKAGTLLVDVHTGMSAFAATQAALADRARGGPPKRRLLDCSLMAGAASLLGIPIAESGLLGRMPAELNVPAGCYQASDGAWVMVALVREADWVALVEVLEAPALLADPRFADFAARAANKPALLPILRDIFARRPVAGWLAALHAKRLLADRVNTTFEWLSDPHVQAVQAAPMLDQPGLGALPMAALPGLGPVLTPAPGLGEHTESVLRQFGVPA